MGQVRHVIVPIGAFFEEGRGTCELRLDRSRGYKGCHGRLTGFSCGGCWPDWPPPGPSPGPSPPPRARSGASSGLPLASTGELMASAPAVKRPVRFTMKLIEVESPGWPCGASDSPVLSARRKLFVNILTLLLKCANLSGLCSGGWDSAKNHSKSNS